MDHFFIKRSSSLYLLDLDSQGGGIMLTVTEDIPSKILITEPSPKERFYVEMKLRKIQYCSFNPGKNKVAMHLQFLSEALTSYSSKYGNITILGDFNVGTDNNHVQVFCNTFNFNF